jgi:Arc/MetJ-type ribon-helix-helix transcriptional regulator
MAKTRGGARPGAGAPKQMDEGRYLTVRLPQSDIDGIDDLAKQKQISWAAVVRRAVRAFLKRYRK